MASKKLQPPVANTPVPPIPVPSIPPIPGLQPVTPTTTTTVPPSTPQTTTPSKGKLVPSNKGKTRLGTVSFEQLPGDPKTLTKTYLKSAGQMVLNAPSGLANFVIGGAIDIGKLGLWGGSKLIPGVDFDPGRMTTSAGLVESAKNTVDFLKQPVIASSKTAPLGTFTPAGYQRMQQQNLEPGLPERYMAAIEANQSILPFLVEDFGNISMAGGLYAGLAKQGVRGVTLGEAAAQAERATAAKLLDDTVPGTAEAAAAAERLAKAEAKITKVQRTKAFLQENYKMGKDLERLANKIGALPFKPYGYGTRKLLGLYRDGIYLGPNGRYARWGAKASEGYKQQAAKLMDEGVPADDPRVVNLMAKAQKAGRRSIAREVMQSVKEASRDASNEQGSAVRAIINQIQEPLHKDVINPETGEAYGNLSLDEVAAILAIQGGNAQIINRLATRYNIPPRILALLGRYDFYQEYSLSERAAEMARDFLNFSPETPGRMTIEQYERLANAAENVAKTVFRNMTERAVQGYGRRNPMPMEQLVPTPFVEGLKRNIIESIKQAEKAIKKEQAKKKPSAAEINRLKLVLADRINVLESWTAVEESGILELPVDHPDRIAVLKGFVDQLPIELALDPTMYSAAMRVPLEFYRRIRRGMAASIIGDTGTEVVPDGGGPGPRLSPTRAAKEGAVEAELAKRSKKAKAIEGKITRVAEELDRKEAQHAKLVERIVRYDIVDAYVGGKSVEQIATEFELDPKLIEDVIKNSPPAKTYRRAQELKKAVDELRAQFTPEQLAAMPEMMAEAQRIIDEANAAQAEYQNVLRLAEEERQQIEAETDRLNDELDVLEDEMADYEDAYEAEGGVVDDLWDADETPTLKPAVEPKPVKYTAIQAVDLLSEMGPGSRPAVEKKIGKVQVNMFDNGTGGRIIEFYLDTEGASKIWVDIFIGKENAEYLEGGPEAIEDLIEQFVREVKGSYQYVKGAQAGPDGKSAYSLYKKPIRISGIDPKISFGEVETLRSGESFKDIDPDEMVNAIEQIGAEIVANYESVVKNTEAERQTLKPVVAEQPATQPSGELSPFKKLTPSWENLRKTKAATFEKDFDSFEQLVAPQAGWKRGDVELYTPANLPGNNEINPRFLPYVKDESYAEGSYLRHFYLSNPNSIILAIDYSGPKFVPHADRIFIAVPETWQEFVEVLKTKIDDSATGKYKTAQNKLKKVLAIAEAQVAKGATRIYRRDEAAAAMPNERQLKLAEDFVHHYNRVRDSLIEHEEGLKEAIAKNSQEGIDYHTERIELDKESLDYYKQEFINDFPFLDMEKLLEIYKDFTLFDRDWVNRGWGQEKASLPGETPAFARVGEEAPQPALTPVQPASPAEFTTNDAKNLVTRIVQTDMGIDGNDINNLASKHLNTEPVELDSMKTGQRQAKYVKDMIKSGRPFQVYLDPKTQVLYWTDSFILISLAKESISYVMGLGAETDGVYVYKGPKNKAPSADLVVQTNDSPDGIKGLLNRYKLDKKQQPAEFLYKTRISTGNEAYDVLVFKDPQTGGVLALDETKVGVFNPKTKIYLSFNKDGKALPAFVVDMGVTNMVMPVRADQLSETPPTVVERMRNFVTELRSSNISEKKTNYKSISSIADAIEAALPQETPAEAAPTPPALRPTEPKAPAKPKATKPSEVKPDTQIVDPVVREAVYTKEVVDSMAAEAAAKMDAAKTVQEKLSAFQEFVDKSKAYDAEVARMAIELEPARNARTKKLKVEQKIAELREAMESLPEEQAAAEASMAAMLSNPFFEPYMKMTGSMPLEIALGGDFPSDIGGFEVPGPDGEGVRLIGPMYYPSGVPRKFYGGIEKETTRLGLPGFKKLASEHYRDGDRQVIFSLRQVAIRMGQEVAQMVKKERFRAIVSRFGSTASEILGEQYVRDLYKQAVAWAENMPQDSLYVRFRSAMAESLGEDMPISGIASPGPGVKGQARVREWAINFRFGELIGDAMRERGFEAIDPYAAIEKMIPAEKITASRGIEEPTDGTGDIGDVTPDEITQETMFLPRGLKEKMVEVIVVKDANRFQKMLTGAQKVTSFFKVGTLVFSIPWQVGDLVSSMIIATMSGVDPRVLIKYMKEIKVQEYGTGRAGLRRMVDPYVDESGKSKLTLRRLRDPEAVTDIGPFRRGPLARLASESGVQNLGQTLQERAYLYGEDLQPERGFLDRISRGRLKRVSDAAAAVTGFSFKVNETINKISRHAFFLEQLDQQLRARGQTLESIKNIEDWQNDAEIKQAVFDAARSANQWLGDYANLSLTERRYITSVFPFWAWIRHIHSVFDLVAVNNPEALFYYMYIGTLASEDEADPLNLRRGGFNIFGGVASSNWLNPFADVVDGPVAAALIDQDLRPAGSMFGPVPRLIGGAVGIDVSRPGSPISRPAGTGGYSETGQRTSGSVLPLLGGSVGETIGFTAQQFPIAQRILNINPTPFENIPGTRVALGQVARYQTGEARLSPSTGQRIQQPGGRTAALLRLFGGPLVPYRTDEQINDVLNAARQRLLTLDELQRIRELQGAP